MILAAALLACIGAMAPAAAPSRAHIVPGEYSISMAGHHQAALGGTVEIEAVVEVE